ncbi:MAG: PIG-L deacetylase family protein [Spirochaetaceae bacterium]
MTIRARNEDGGEGGARVVTQTSIAAAFAAGDGGAADLDRERWLFLTPHDDDVVLGAGMLLEEATRTGIRTTVCVVTDGRMGYCRPEQRDDIIAIRRAETERAMELLGGPAIRRLDYPDCDLPNHAGRRRIAGGAEGISDGASTGAAVDYPDPRGGHTGLQNSFTALLRDLRPTRVFVPTGADYHPDHQIVHRELLISLFHATGAIWPELGAPLPAPPQLYETAIYCDFPAPPTLQIQGSPEAFERKLGAVIAFASQEQIAAIVDGVRSAGPFEYVRAVPFSLYDSRRYAKLFGGDGAT